MSFRFVINFFRQRKQIAREIESAEQQLEVLGKKRRLAFRTRKYLRERIELLRRMDSVRKQGEKILKLASDYISLFGVPDFEGKLKYAPALGIHTAIAFEVAKRGKGFFGLREGTRLFSWAIAENVREAGVVHGYKSKNGIRLVVVKGRKEEEYNLSIDKRFSSVSEQFLKKATEFSELHHTYTKKYTK